SAGGGPLSAPPRRRPPQPVTAFPEGGTALGPRCRGERAPGRCRVLSQGRAVPVPSSPQPPVPPGVRPGIVSPLPARIPITEVAAGSGEIPAEGEGDRSGVAGGVGDEREAAGGPDRRRAGRRRCGAGRRCRAGRRGDP